MARDKFSLTLGLDVKAHANMGSLNLRCLLLLFIIKVLIVQSVNVSSKLDFGEQSDLVQVKKELKTGKVKGLRVIVDTSELKESKSSSGSESSSSNESPEKRKTIGVRTDVTFEITSGETNDTKTVDEKEIGKEDDNASIPIVVFKGTPDRGSRKGGSKDNDIWSVKPLENPSPPTRPFFRSPPNRNGPSYGGVEDRNRFGGTEDRNRFGGAEDRNRFGLGFGGAEDRNRYGETDNRNRYGLVDDRNRYGGADEGFKQTPQFAIWTTERYNLQKQHDQPVFHHRGQYDGGFGKPPPSNFIPYHHQVQQHERHMPWQHCNCKEYPGPLINPQQPSSDELHRSRKVDDKLDKPFSKTS